MNCTLCGHPDHGPGPCPHCLENGTCWQRIKIVGGDGEQTATGLIEMATGKETQPCLMCRKWEDVETAKVVQHFLAKGLEVQPDGTFKTPIAHDIPGRKSLILDPKNFGFCRRDLMPTDAMASCANWVPTKHLSDFQQRMSKRQ